MVCAPPAGGEPRASTSRAGLLSCPASAPTLPQVQHKKAAPNPRSCPSLRSSWGKGERTQCWEPIHFTHLVHNTHIVRSLAAQTSAGGGKAMLMAGDNPALATALSLPSLQRHGFWGHPAACRIIYSCRLAQVLSQSMLIFSVFFNR